MQTLYQILALAGAGLIIWYLYRVIKGRPDQFSKENLSKSAYSLGILGVILIAFVALLIFLVKNT